MTIDFDVARSWHDLERHQQLVASARERQLLEIVIAHIKAEIERDVDAVMALLVSEPKFHVWAGGRDIGPKGADEVRQYYEALFAGGGAVFESIKDRIVIAGNTVAHEGPVRNLLPGQIAQRRGYAVPHEDEHYLVRFRNCVWWSFDESGRALGEDSYTTIDLEAWQLVPREELPGIYLDYLAELR
jgi:hypothetical protein